MIPHISEKENLENAVNTNFISAIKELWISGLLAFISNHVTGKTVKGFNLLTIGWTDGYSFIPAAFSMLSSAKPSRRLNEMKESVDKRTNGFKNRAAAARENL